MGDAGSGEERGHGDVVGGLFAAGEDVVEEPERGEHDGRGVRVGDGGAGGRDEPVCLVVVGGRVGERAVSLKNLPR
ncbi:hypothetical protein, partial [Streptomyces sp. NE06-03C]|uniref:hypothetical protein n=1 Tax=Streptomyces sp. NE06-03C TaxID=3028694 RepID=UPI0029B78F9B